MLKTASGADKRFVKKTRLFYGEDRTLGTLVRAARRCPKAIKPIQTPEFFLFSKGRGGEPDNDYFEPQMGSCILESVIRSLVRRVLGVKVPNDADI